MGRQQTTILLAIGALTALLLPLLVYRQFHAAPRLQATEQTVAAFTPTSLLIPRRGWQTVTLAPPVGLPAPAVPQPAPSAKAGLPLPVATPPPTVSFILHDAGKDLAIVNGVMVKVGDRYQEWQVTRIERNRVLLHGRKGPLWIALQ